MSILSGIKRIFIHDSKDFTRRAIPVDKIKHGSELQKMADETSEMVEIEFDNGDRRYLQPKDIFSDRIHSRHMEMVW